MASPNDRAEAERLTDKTIRPSPWPAIIMAAILLAAMVRAVAANANECCSSHNRHGGDYQGTGRLHDGAKCFNEWGERGTYYGLHCYRDSDDREPVLQKERSRGATVLPIFKESERQADVRCVRE